MATLGRSICFREAYDLRSEGRIQIEEYLNHIVAHYGGFRHETDLEGNQPFLYTGFEDEVREFTLGKEFQPLDETGTALLYSLFLSAFQGDFATVQNSLHSSTLAVRTYLGPLVEISKETGDARLFRLCLGMGYNPTGYNESNRILNCRTERAPSREWLDALYDFDFRHWRTERQQLNKWETWHYVLNMGPDCVRWWIDHGGCTPSARDLFWDDDTGWPEAPAFRVLLDHFGIDWFTNSGTLQLAAEKQDFETVEMLLEAGANVNEDVEDWGFDVRENRQAPLPALKMAMYAKSEKMIRYLVDHGAKLSRQQLGLDNPYDRTPEEFKIFKRLIVELGGVE